MTVKKIVDPAFTMNINDAKLAAVLEKLNKNKDEQIDLSDFQFPVSGVSENTRLQLMRELVVGAFAEAGYVKGDKQKTAMLDFFGLSERVSRFASAVPVWMNNGSEVRSPGHGLRLMLSSEYCHSTEYGYTDHVRNMDRMTQDLVSTLLYLSGEESTKDMPPTKTAGSPCGKSLTGLHYNEKAVPVALKEHVSRVVGQYLDAASWLFKYDSIACLSGQGYPPGDISGLRELAQLPRLEKIQAGTKNELDIHEYPECQQPWL